MMIPCQLSTFSEFICSAFQFHGHLAQKYEWMPEKDQMKSERVENWWCGFARCILNTQRVWSSNKFKIMKSLCNRWVFVRNPDTSKEIVQFVHEVHPVFAMNLSTFLHMLCGWNDDIPCQVSTFSEFICRAFQFQGHLAQNKSVNAWKTTNYVGNGWKLMTWLGMVHAECKKCPEL